MKSNITKRQLGQSDIFINPMGLGLMSLSGIYGTSDDENATNLIRQAIDMGVDFLDSADMYGWGHNETLLSTSLKGLRDRVVLASKFGQVKNADGTQGVNGKPDYVRAACEASLQRLQTDVIDLYYIHRIDKNVPIEETIGAMADLVKAGKVRTLGICEANPDTIRRAHAIHPISAIQTEYSLLYREPAEETLKTTRELGISFVAYAPLGRSLLTGAVKSAGDVSTDRRKDHPRFQEENLLKNLTLLSPLQEMAATKGCTPGQLALTWLLAQGDDVVVIPGTKKIERMTENFMASHIKLTPSEVSDLTALFPSHVASGTRYPAGGMKGVFL